MSAFKNLFKRQPIVEYFQGRDGRWYFHLRARNGKIVGDAGQGYSSKSNALRAVKTRYPKYQVIKKS